MRVEVLEVEYNIKQYDFTELDSFDQTTSSFPINVGTFSESVLPSFWFILRTDGGSLFDFSSL